MYHVQKGNGNSMTLILKTLRGFIRKVCFIHVTCILQQLLKLDAAAQRML